MFAMFWIVLSIAFPVMLAESLSPFWKYLAWIASGGFAVFVFAAVYDALQMRVSITRTEICRSSPFRWMSWSIPITASRCCECALQGKA